MKNINSSFIVCGSLSLIGVALSTFTPIPLPIAVVLELGPLAWYFSRLLQIARHDSIGQTAVDSVYYFGFLITIFSLAASVFHVWLNGVGNNVESLIAHFGVGLLATGLALAFRMWLTAVSEQLNKKDLDETIEGYIRRVDDVVAKVEMSAASFEGLSTSLQQHTEKVVLHASNCFESAMAESTKIFREKLDVLMREGTSAAQLFSNTIKELSTAEHVVSFDKNMITLTTGFKTVINQLSISGKELGENAQRTTAKALNDTVSIYSKNLEELTAQNREAMNEVLAGVDDLDFADDAAIVREHMQSLSTTVNNINKKFGAIEEKIELAVVRQSAETIRLVIDGFSSEFKRITTSIEDESLNRIQAILANIAKTTTDAIHISRESATKQFTKDLAITATEIGTIADLISSRKMAEQFTKLADATEEAHLALSDSADEFAIAVKEMQQLEIRIAAINPVLNLDSARANVADFSAALQECRLTMRQKAHEVTAANPEEPNEDGTARIGSHIGVGRTILTQPQISGVK